ncbi:MAG: hypothetical protein CBE00_03205 [Planctomycetaceae bacterium TMED240]|nr:MAG: hypothetical protein CBE00_03205 [Planctomycetaceae bacterium TMED240]
MFGRRDRNPRADSVPNQLFFQKHVICGTTRSSEMKGFPKGWLTIAQLFCFATPWSGIFNLRLRVT